MTFICTGVSKTFVWLTLLQYLLIGVGWNWTCSISEVCLTKTHTAGMCGLGTSSVYGSPPGHLFFFRWGAGAPGGIGFRLNLGSAPVGSPPPPFLAYHGLLHRSLPAQESSSCGPLANDGEVGGWTSFPILSMDGGGGLYGVLYTVSKGSFVGWSPRNPLCKPLICVPSIGFACSPRCLTSLLSCWRFLGSLPK